MKGEPREGAAVYPLTGDRDEEECRRDPRVLLVLAAMDVSTDVTDLLSGLSPAVIIDRAQWQPPRPKRPWHNTKVGRRV